MSSRLSQKEIIEKLARCRGLIPVGIDIENRELIWRDLGQFHNYEGFFSSSLLMLTQLNAVARRQETDGVFRTDLNVLDSDEILTDCIYPTGFIFHGGRCGSTLLSKSLARSRMNLVFGEAEPHNQIWSIFTDDWQSSPNFGEAEQHIYKNLILTMGRRRLETHRNHIIKFTSFNILLFDLIRSVFPDVPALFIYREPSAILRSFLKSPPGWAMTKASPLEAFVAGVNVSDIGTQSKTDLYQKAVARFFSAALDAENTGLKFLSYDQLKPANLTDILSTFAIPATPEELNQMRDQFEYDSKTEYKLKPYEKIDTPDSSEIPENLFDLYQRLLNSHQK